MEIQGKNIVITGGGRGMGKRFAVAVQDLGAKPFVVDLMQDHLTTLKKETGIDGKVIDVTDERAVEEF